MSGATPGEGGTTGPWRTALTAVLVLAAAAFLYSLRDLLNPFLLYWVFVAASMPFRGAPGHRALLVVATVLVAIWVLHVAGSLLAPFFLAFVLAYVLDPVVDRVSRSPRVSRSVAIAIIGVPVVVLAASALLVAVPAGLAQGRALAAEAPGLADRVAEWVRGLDPAAPGFDVPLLDEAALLERLRNIDSETVAGFLESRGAELGRRAWATVLGLGRGFATLLTVAGYLVLTPVLLFYLLRDYDRIVARVDALLPARVRPAAASLLGDYDDLLSRYLRGQVAVSLATGAATWLGLAVAAFPYAFLLGATVAVLGVVPYLGVAVSLIPAVVLALTSDDVGLSLAKLAIVYGIAQGLESAVISPRIVGDSVGLHPVWILLALSLGGFFFGFTGLLIGVPLAVGVKLLLVRGLDRYKRTSLYRPDAIPS